MNFNILVLQESPPKQNVDFVSNFCKGFDEITVTYGEYLPK